MDPTREFGRIMIGIGLLIAVLGLILYLGARLPFRLGHLPGDIEVHGRHGTFYFPIVTCLLVSVILTLLMWLIEWLRK